MRLVSKHNFYDLKGLFKELTSTRENEIIFNDLVETLTLLRMLPNLQDKSVIDTGCGTGQLVKHYFELGAKPVLSIDIS